MATKDQFDAFKMIFTLEEDRARSLTETGKNLNAILVLLFGLNVYRMFSFRAADYLDVASSLAGPQVLFGFILPSILLLAGIGFTLASLSVHPYTEIVDPKEMFERSIEGAWGDDLFYDYLIASMNRAYEDNSNINDHRAYKLSLASWFIGLGLASIVLVMILINFGILK